MLVYLTEVVGLFQTGIMVVALKHWETTACDRHILKLLVLVKRRSLAAPLQDSCQGLPLPRSLLSCVHSISGAPGAVGFALCHFLVIPVLVGNKSVALLMG